MWMNYMKSMMGGSGASSGGNPAGGSGAPSMPGGGSQPNWSMPSGSAGTSAGQPSSSGSQNPMEAMEQWQRFYQQMQQQ